MEAIKALNDSDAAKTTTKTITKTQMERLWRKPDLLELCESLVKLSTLNYCKGRV
jgi:hypothetical protein